MLQIVFGRKALELYPISFLSLLPEKKIKPNTGFYLNELLHNLLRYGTIGTNIFL